MSNFGISAENIGKNSDFAKFSYRAKQNNSFWSNTAMHKKGLLENWLPRHFLEAAAAFVWIFCSSPLWSKPERMEGRHGKG